MSSESDRILRDRKNNPNYVDSSSITDFIDSDDNSISLSDKQQYFSDTDENTVNESIIDLTQNCSLTPKTIETGLNSIIDFKNGISNLQPVVVLKKIDIKQKMGSFKEISSMLKSVESFGGPSKNVKLDFDKFCNSVDLVWENLGTDKNAQILFMKMIKNKLCDNAYEIVRYTVFNEWPELKRALHSKFIIRRSQGVVASELVNVKQSKNSEIRLFANKVQNLLNELNEICIEKQGIAAAVIIKKINEDLALNAFQNGIFDQFLKIIVKSFHFDNLEQSIEKAIDEEKCQVDVKKDDVIICTYCKKKGHSQERCYKKQNNSKNRKPDSQVNKNESNESSSNSEINKNKPFCTYCHKNNHVVQNCFKKNNKIFINSNKTVEAHKVEINSDQNNINENFNQASTSTCSISSSLSSDSKNFERPESTAKMTIRVDEI